MTATNPRQPRWVNGLHTAIDLVVTIDGMDAAHTVLQGSDLFARAAGGEFGVVTAYAAPRPSAQTLRFLADAKCDAVSDAGISVTLSGGRVALADTNVAGRAAIMNLRDAVKPVTWYQSTGALSLDELDIARIGAAVFAHVQAALATWMALCAAIEAGTITSHEQIETPPAPIPAWPSSIA